jgi:hypothetical protein
MQKFSNLLKNAKLLHTKLKLTFSAIFWYIQVYMAKTFATKNSDFSAFFIFSIFFSFVQSTPDIRYSSRPAKIFLISGVDCISKLFYIVNLMPFFKISNPQNSTLDFPFFILWTLFPPIHFLPSNLSKNTRLQFSPKKQLASGIYWGHSGWALTQLDAKKT